MVRAISTQTSLRPSANPLANQLANHRDKSRMIPDRGGSNHVQAKFVAQFLSLCVEVEEDFQVIGDKSDWRHDDIGRFAELVQLAQVVTHIGLKPRLRWRTAATLVHETPSLIRKSLADQAA